MTQFVKSHKRQAFRIELLSILFFSTFSCYVAAAAPLSQVCTYSTWEWNVKLKKSQNHRRIEKLRSALTVEELGSDAECSVCEEDQENVTIAGLAPFKLCRKYHAKILRALNEAKQNGFRFISLVGYRVGRSKGPISVEGLRTQFSNHSFGVAIDVNSELNGLYDSCLSFSPQCRLLRGGIYQPTLLGGISSQSAVYKFLRAAGLSWGGEIKSRQKDFMHFSPDGF